jgi:hypothetical protein
MHLMHIIETMIQDIALRFHELDHPPHSLHGKHLLVPKRIGFPASYKWDLLQLKLVATIMSCFTISTPTNDREVAAVPKSGTLVSGAGIGVEEDCLG